MRGTHVLLSTANAARRGLSTNATRKGPVVPPEVYPLIVLIGGAITGGSLFAMRKLGDAAGTKYTSELYNKPGPSTSSYLDRSLNQSSSTGCYAISKHIAMKALHRLL